MILLVVLASVLIALVSIYQYNEESQDYHKSRLERKEQNIQEHINYVLRETTYEIKTEKIPLIFKEKIYEIATIHKLQLNLYDLEGNLLKSSLARIKPDSLAVCLDADILNSLSKSEDKRYVEKRLENGETFLSSYSYITDGKYKPLAILNLPYLEKDEFLSRELNEFLIRLAYAYVVMLLIAIILAYFSSKYITRTLKTISDKIYTTRLEKRNEKINIQTKTEEISTLVDSYNSMIDELEESAVKLATSEREQAWREMAKQVAHEIKNPLTPMRLSVQSFQAKFNPNDPEIHQKVDEFSNTLIQQIDIMSSIASAFSNFAEMPAQKVEMLNIVEVVNLALDIFNEKYITFSPSKSEITAKFDRTQLIRVVTNLVKNGIQSIPKGVQPEIEVTLSEEKGNIILKVKDNGIGISDENKEKVFEPKFTTKTSGMGLGLAMVKNIVNTYKGIISFKSNKNNGTTFTVVFPKE
jgi:signal transduction histidine kinase